ncbi:MAG: cell division protein FtsZ, partial [Lachnospiraceae bacterium]|nr:cell division protein FtsZ [Lachnospiraceae bacterium]
TTVTGATDIIVNFSGNIGIVEAYDAITYLTEVAGDNANIIFGTVDNDNMGEDVCITIIATGIEANAANAATVSTPQVSAPKAKTSVTPIGGAPTYSGQPITTGTTSSVKPSFLNTPVKPATAGVDMTATKATPVRPQPAAANNPNGIKIPDFLKRG